MAPGRWLTRARALLRRSWLALRLGLAARRLRRAHSAADRELARRSLHALFGTSRGLALKVGQVLAGLQGTDPAALVVTARPLAQMRPHLARALGLTPGELDDLFPRLDEALGAASLGQVHRAELADGRAVAIKLRYPDIADAVAAELQLAGLVPGAGPVARFGFPLEGYRRTLASNMARELDYRGEAERQARFRERVQVPGLVVPAVLPEFTREAVLVQELITGEPLTAARDWPLQDRAGLARILLETLFHSLFVTGELHADPNPGNYLVRRGLDGRDGSRGRPELALLDYGCTLELARERRLALLQLLLGCREAAPVDALAAFAALGFDGAKLAYLADRLAPLCQLLFEPFLTDRAFDPARWELGPRVEKALGEHKWWFRAAGPPDVLFLLRAFQGTITHLVDLDVRLPWWPLLTRVCGEALFAEARSFVLPAVAGRAAHRALLSALARSLQVRLTQGDEELVSLTLPAAEVLHLTELIPEEIQPRLAAAGIHLAAVSEEIAAQGIAPRELFRLDEGGGKQLRVWLE